MKTKAKILTGNKDELICIYFPKEEGEMPPVLNIELIPERGQSVHEADLPEDYKNYLDFNLQVDGNIRRLVGKTKLTRG